ncbi:acetyl-CoA C-acetyltransferase [Pullulanibacillus pueri]|uniref:acetyl-CoA C-acetyltransferase n=1 Tax=Pullulanibacillus pueri TaxID=1437324 RepID=A0A8J3A041_9BACL|nr:acetyl-CoA C-acetyltransferase [Pullulanibacillus pueri]MBM7681698.1 acetyl-CoA C-acetyltransferase [Pullulanibacillus pueri]GGH87049.1 acetyl-CoA acetyltransferase [Pullulanibacillus pueri]
MKRTVITAAARTPFGKFGGGLSSLSAIELGGQVIKAVKERAGIDGEAVDEVIMGMVLQGGQGQIPSRQAAQKAGLPWSVKTETINKVCASGLRSVTLGDQIIRAGDAQVIIAGGMESMSHAPYILPNARWGYRMGDQQVVDLMVHDGLTCAFNGVHMGIYGSNTAEKHGISRLEQDQWALRSHQRAAAAIDSGKFSEEIIPVEVPQRKGDPRVVSTDEAVRRDTTLEKLQRLKPAFSQDGTVTAGNAPGVNDGAGAFVLMDEAVAADQGKEVLATILGHTAIAVEAKDFPETPGLVIRELLKKTGKTLADIDLFEINEAFAAVALTSQKLVGIDPEKINVNGGAVALGHPIGASGARILMTLIYELKRRGGGLGMASICSGGGQGDAILIQV